MAAAREAADAAVAGHSATEVVRGKEHWLYFTHPERPVAGAQVAIYFNNNVSDILRFAPRSVVLIVPTPMQAFARFHAVHPPRLLHSEGGRYPLQGKAAAANTLEVQQLGAGGRGRRLAGSGAHQRAPRAGRRLVVRAQHAWETCRHRLSCTVRQRGRLPNYARRALCACA